MKIKNVFQRYETKYIISQTQKQEIISKIAPYMSLDPYGHSTIRNIYFDTDTYLLIRRSIEKPVYKEKLRIRSYQKVENNNPVFVELKKKFKGVVYKRRCSLSENDAMRWICEKQKRPNDTQIVKEIDYFIHHYENLHPTLFLSYEREAFYCKDENDLRITFDENILCRENNLSLTEDVEGISILEKDKILMEIKCTGAIPLWMVHLLSDLKLYKTSFSKYGIAYRTLIFSRLKGEVRYNGNNL